MTSNPGSRVFPSTVFCVLWIRTDACRRLEPVPGGPPGIRNIFQRIFSLLWTSQTRRMFPIFQNKETIVHEILNHFKKNKVEIANAITKPFPFFESLRDLSFITEEMYNDSQEACRNLVPVGKVVYQILCNLEKTFDGSLLQAIFSRTHLKEYPDLIPIHRSFENVIQYEYCLPKSDRGKTKNMPSTEPSCEQGVFQPQTHQFGTAPLTGPGEMTPWLIPEPEGHDGQLPQPGLINCAQSEMPSLQLNNGQAISGELKLEDVPPEAYSSAPGRGPGEEGEVVQPGNAEHQASECRAPVS
ncbi:sp110 nuclear body protein-like isoform X3 [Pteropus vampyrus]|uniref:Sp110 nuclear body protein-like isoform X3 n=2 Tax=Pteropus vampyrus TaxID=132908 RepID=A0A6P3RTB6_PTEVA|nr:sp110 nuclear body protein-like isoform X3 [Pteropus vampyrus]